jgi:hypothetical protein
LASIKLKRANHLALFAPLVRSKAYSLFQTGRIDNGFQATIGSWTGQPRGIDVEKSYGQKTALAVGAMR